MQKVDKYNVIRMGVQGEVWWMNDRIKHQMVSIVFLLSNNTRIRPPFCRHRVVLWRVCITHARIKDGCCISSIRCPGYYYFTFVWLLSKGGIYFFGKPTTSMTAGYVMYKWDSDAVSRLSMYSLWVLLSAVEITRTEQIALALAWWLSSEIIRMHVRVPHIY